MAELGKFYTEKCRSHCTHDINILSVVGDRKQAEMVVTNVNFFKNHLKQAGFATFTRSHQLFVAFWMWTCSQAEPAPYGPQQTDVCLLGDSDVLLRLFAQLITLMPETFVPD